MKKRLLPLFLFPTLAFAQGKNFTMAEAVTGLGTTLAVENIRGVSFVSGMPLMQYNAKQSGKDVWVRRNLSTSKNDTLNLARINQTLFGGDTLKAFPQMSWLENGRGYFVQGNKVYFATAQMPETMRAEAKELKENAANVEVHPATGDVAYTVDNNIFLHTGAKTIQITNDGSYTIVNGQSVHRNEFGIDGGLFFSPKGNHLAYYRMDQSAVKDYPVVDWKAMPAASHNIKYPMAGDSSHEVTLHVFHPSTGQTTVLQTGEPRDQYLTAVTWSPDEKSIFIGLLNRDQNHLRIVQFDAMTGAMMKTIFEERSEKYVEPQHPFSFLPGSTNEALWWSQRDGYMHLYRYDMATGKLLNQVTKGDWLVNEILGFHTPTDEVLITGTKDGAQEKQAYAVNWKTGKMRRLTQGAGTHTVIASADGKFLYDNFSSNITPRIASLISTATGKSETLLTAKDPLTGYNRPQVRDITLKADDGTPLYGKLILPTNFDSTRKYPCITYLYNGPHVQLVRNTWPASGNLWYELLAQKGYVVFTMDGRGSSNRGLQFESAPFRNLGTAEMSDQLKGNTFLRRQAYIDTARMGVHGWSFGGFMTTSLMLRNPGAYKVGVAGGPVLDWKWYEIMYTERYMDRPQDNPAGYEANHLWNKVKNLRGNLMLIHGTDDDVVVWQHSINFLRNCVENGVQVDYFVYPGHPHNVRGKDRIHLMQKITDYFDEKLK